MQLKSTELHVELKLHRYKWVLKPSDTGYTDTRSQLTQSTVVLFCSDSQQSMLTLQFLKNQRQCHHWLNAPTFSVHQRQSSSTV